MQLPYANMHLKHWNPGAEMPLILPVHLICNTSDEQIFKNIRENSRTKGDWIRLASAHTGVAILCGSGPSLADSLETIRQKAATGGKVFAMNGAAKFLADHGILADYQVLIDARPETAELIGPAKEHLFASQVSPECFRRVPDARLWHLQVGNIEALFPEYKADYCLIGGAASVGNTATCLAYAMGYRDLQLFGYDSSHRDGNGHAFSQPMNDGDPCAVVAFNGKEYTASLTMKLQAEKFQETSRALKASGCHIEVHGSGLLPDMYRDAQQPISEAEKYERMWTYPEYRIHAPGEECADKFIEIVKPRGVVIDFGCGTGRGGLKISTDPSCAVVLTDLTDNSRDEAAKNLPFVQLDLSEPILINGDYGYCTDVMEHIPPEQVDQVIQNILASTPRAFFQISLVDDSMGELIGHPLHLSVHPATWWHDTFTRLGLTVEWFEAGTIDACFYVHG